MDPQRALELEHYPPDLAKDETDYAVRAYFTRMSDEKLAEYDPGWSDEQLIEWDGNFKTDGGLMLVCCERDIEVNEYRQVLEEHLKARGIQPKS